MDATFVVRFEDINDVRMTPERLKEWLDEAVRNHIEKTSYQECQTSISFSDFSILRIS
jgi:hypothetical protein